MVLLTAIALTATAILVPRASAQVTTNVTCSGSTSWMQNSLGQNPCLVSAYLSSVCNAGSWFVPSLVAQGPYNPPQGNGVTPCRCNTVTYSLISACSACQNGLVGTWSDWITYCPTDFVTNKFPQSVPSGTAIPGWADIDPTTSGSWNETAADQYALENGTSSKKKSSNAGAIAGGVIGGIAGLIILGLAGWWWWRRRTMGRGQKVTAAPYDDPGLGDGGYDHAGYVEKPDEHQPGNVFTPPPPGPFKPYDPSDPSTFPQNASPAPTSTYVEHNQTGGQSTYGYPPYQSGSPAPYGGPAAPQHGAYTGAAEV